MFDSGIGGLSVLVEIHRTLPHEDLLYVADSGHAPYGEKPRAVIEARAAAIVSFLAGQGAKAVVVACNTATSVAVEGLRAQWRMPIVAIEPAIKPAVATTRSGVVGVLATSQTIASERFARLVARFGAAATVAAQPCAGLVEQVERGELDTPATRTLVEQCVRPLVARGADTLVLGCTHYPFVAPLIQEIAGPGVTILNPAAAVARELERRLMERQLLSPAHEAGRIRCWTSGSTRHLRRLLAVLSIDAGAVHALPV